MGHNLIEAMIDIERSYGIAPKVSVRPERFGGLVYRYDNRALYFLHSRPLVDFLLELDDTQPLGIALDGFVEDRGLGAKDRRNLETALGQLKKKGVLHEL